MNSAKYAKEIAPVKLNVRAQWKEAFQLLVLSRKVEMRTENTQLFGWRKGRALRAHNLLKQKGLIVLLLVLSYMCLRGAQLLT
jgi:hypothetical protein